jgi:hypothetical protein
MKSGSAEVTFKTSRVEPVEPILPWVVLVSRHGNAQIPMVQETWRSDPETRVLDDGTIRTVGTMHIIGLAPGDYTLAIWPGTEQLEYYDQAVLAELMRSRGSALHLGAGERRFIELARKPDP